MFSTLVNAWKIKDIRTKMLYTMLLIVIYRLGSFIPVPGVNAAAITQYAEQYDMLASICSPAALSVTFPSLQWAFRHTSPAL